MICKFNDFQLLIVLNNSDLLFCGLKNPFSSSAQPRFDCGSNLLPMNTRV